VIFPVGCLLARCLLDGLMVLARRDAPALVWPMTRLGTAGTSALSWRQTPAITG
jgi:hypothetical protein